MRAALASLPEAARGRLRRQPQPDWASPMLATLTEKRFSDDDWLFERKLDGERCPSFGRGGDLRLLSRNRKQLNATYPELVDALREQEADEFIATGFTEVTGDGKLRHPRFRGLRRDKRPREVILERPRS